MATLPNRNFAALGQAVSVVGLGGAFLDSKSFEDGVASVRRALELGVNYFDTSPGYCNRRSEVILGEALHGRREPHVVATKVGYFGTRRGYRSEDAIREQIYTSLKLLRRKSVDVLQVHEADLACWWCDDGGVHDRIVESREYDFADAPVMRVLREAKRDGLCRAIGITGNSQTPMARVLSSVDVDVFLMALSYDVIWRSARELALPIAATKNKTIVLGGIFQCGRLAQPHPEWLVTPPDWMDDDLRARFARLYEIQAKSKLSLAELAIRFMLQEGRASTILLGAATPAEVEQNVAAVNAGALPVDIQSAIEGIGTM